MNFDATGHFAAAAGVLSLNIPNGAAFTLDMSQSSQLAANYTVLNSG
jgi:hypothetical protein